MFSCRPLLGFLIASAPLSAALMGWQGAGGGGAATIGTYYFFGGMLQVIGSILEWFIGNTFPFVVFGSFGKPGVHLIRPCMRPTLTPQVLSGWLLPLR